MGPCGAPEQRPWRLEAPLGLALSWSLGPPVPRGAQGFQQVQSLDGEDPLEEGMATCSRGAWQATVHGVTESDTAEQRSMSHIQRQMGDLCRHTSPPDRSHVLPAQGRSLQGSADGDLWQCGLSGRTVSGGSGVFGCPSTPCLLRAPVFALRSHQEMRCLDWGRQRLGTQGRRLAVASFLISVFRCPPGDETHYLLES